MPLYGIFHTLLYHKAHCPSTFSSIAIELNLKMSRKINLSYRQSVNGASVYLSVLRFCSIEIELNEDSKGAIIGLSLLGASLN